MWWAMTSTDYRDIAIETFEHRRDCARGSSRVVRKNVYRVLAAPYGRRLALIVLDMVFKPGA